jgi:hypothetical protein
MNRRLAVAGVLFFGLLACNSTPKPITQCTIAGITYSDTQPNPANACQICVPAKAVNNWTDAPSGTACGSGGALFCSGGYCLSGCLISGTFYPAGASNPTNGCQSCDPTKSGGAWTSLSGVVAGACAAGQICETGACASACSIGGSFFTANAVNPTNSCQTCQPGQTDIAWTDLAPGSSCADGGAICSAGSCQAGCEIGGVFYTKDATSPSDVCRTCQPGVSTTSFTDFTGVASGGCIGGLYCDHGHCSNGCQIGGSTQVPGTINPDNGCQSCQPSVSLTSWSDLPAGTTCGVGGAVCAGGVCLVGCEIAGVLYAPGSADPASSCLTCQPAVSSVSFSPFTGIPSAPCTGGEICNGGVCAAGCFIKGALVPTRAYKPNDTSFCCSPGTDPSTWTQSFTRSASYAVGGSTSFCGSGTQGIATGDFNADGLPDVAVICTGNSTVSVFLNQGGGVFAAEAPYPTGSSPQSLAVGDLNGDGLDDVVVTDNSSGNKLGVLFSLGFDAGFDAGLAAESDTALSGGGFFFNAGIQLKDLNGDRALDVIVGNGAANKDVSIFLNKGDGGLSSEVTYIAPDAGFATQVAVGDFNGDGFPDIAVVNGFFGNAAMAVLFNDQTGKFTAGASFKVDSFTMGLTTGDFNADGMPDVAVSTYYQMDTLEGIGDGGFLPSVSHRLTASGPIDNADLNGDGFSDIVVLGAFGGSVNVFVNKGTGAFLPVSTIPGQAGASFVIHDFNEDGAPDLAVVDNGGNSWTLWLNSCP